MPTVLIRSTGMLRCTALPIFLLFMPVVSPAHEIIIKVRSEADGAAGTWRRDAPDPGNPLSTLHDSAGASSATPVFMRHIRTDIHFATFDLHRYLLVRLPDSADPVRSLSRYRRHRLVEHAGLNSVFSINLSPEDADPLEPEQWALETIRARQGRDIERGHESVPVAIIDTGVDYTHPDLAPSIWINHAEDTNGNGRFDPIPAIEGGDFNESDDDGNGYADDVIGWDFTDAPELPGSGDWKERDNDPMDEGPQSHGTHVAGIACAAADNGEGIAGVAPGCRIMVLRAGFGPVGYLQEDDVSSAIVYAVQNGAAVINMSWGDVVVSPMIRDVIAYAHAHDCVLVASAGNSGTDQLHYPSGYDYTISVGNSSMEDELTPGSNYGPTIDVVAPGQRILSTLIGGTYGTLNGTSMSAPHVSGLAALIRSHRPSFSNEEVRHAIIAGAADLGATGVDQYFGGGRIDIPASLELDRVLTAIIEEPSTDEGIAEDIVVTGTVRGLLLDWWRFSYGSGRSPVIWHDVGSIHEEQVFGDTLEVIPIDDMSDGQYVIRLVAEDIEGVRIERRTPVLVDRSPPVFLSHDSVPVVEGPYGHFLIEFTTDDITTAGILMRPAGSDRDFTEYPLSYTTDSHRWLLGPDIPGYGAWEYTINAVNISNLSSSDDNNGALYRVNIRDTAGSNLYLPPVSMDLPAGYLVPRSTDFDDDGYKEIGIAELVPSAVTGESTLGDLRLFELDSGLNVTEVNVLPTQMYPLGVHDGDNDGLQEILGHYWARVPVPDTEDSTNIFVSYLWEPEEPGGFPATVSWSDSGSNLVLGMADADEDGWGELYILNQEIYPRTRILVYEAYGNDSYGLIDTLIHPFPDAADFVLRTMAAGDGDGDGLPEVVFGDRKGRLIAYEVNGAGVYEYAWDSISSAGEDGVVEAIAMGDVDGNPGDEFVGLIRYDENFNLEHNFDSRRWFLSFGNVNGQVGEIRSEIILMGVDTETALNGLQVGDIDGDEDSEIVVSVYPDCYVFDFDAHEDSLEIIWYADGVDTWTALIDDLHGPAMGSRGNELVLSYDNGTRIHSGDTAFPGPSPPAYLDIEPRESTVMLLRWPAVQGVSYYRIHRGLSPEVLNPVAETDGTSYTDSGLIDNTTYYYAVSAVDTAGEYQEGPPGTVASITTLPAPGLVDISYLPPYQILLEFDQRLDVNSAKEPGHYRVEPGGIAPSSAVITQSEYGVILSFPELEGLPGSYTIRMDGVRGYSGIPVPPGDSPAVTIRESEELFYVERVTYSGNGWLDVRFNNPPDSTLGVDDVSIEPELGVFELIRDTTDGRLVRVRVMRPERIDGTVYVMRIRDIDDIHGNPIQTGEGDASGFHFFADDLVHWYPVPNPWNPATGPSQLKFFGSPPDAVIRIYALNGRQIAEFSELNTDGVVEWDGMIAGSGSVPSGAYICRITSSVGHRSERLIVTR